MNERPWPGKVFAAKLRHVGTSYHHKHPFHVLMNTGRLDAEAIRIWVANRFYYQTGIPIKDAAIMSNLPHREIRRLWLHRITDHDGTQGDEGGIGKWLRLGAACGLPRAALVEHRHVVPGVRYAVDAYVNFARTAPWPVAVASSLTELFAPDLMAKRLAAFQKYYTWIDASGLEYFQKRLVQAPRDSGEALALTVKHCHTRELQAAALAALRFKCDLLWAMLDAIHARCFGLAKPAAGSLTGRKAGHRLKKTPSRK